MRDDYKIKEILWWWSNSIHTKKNTKNNNKTCVELQLINSLCYFWDDWWWCTHDVKVSMKVLIKNLFFVWKKCLFFLSYNFCTVIPRWWVNWNIHVNQIATFVPCEPAQILMREYFMRKVLIFKVPMRHFLIQNSIKLPGIKIQFFSKFWSQPKVDINIGK